MIYILILIMKILMIVDLTIVVYRNCQFWFLCQGECQYFLRHIQYYFSIVFYRRRVWQFCCYFWLPWTWAATDWPTSKFNFWFIWYFTHRIIQNITIWFKSFKNIFNIVKYSQFYLSFYFKYLRYWKVKISCNFIWARKKWLN